MVVPGDLLKMLFASPDVEARSVDVARAYLLHVLRRTPLTESSYDGLLHTLEDHLGAPSDPEVQAEMQNSGTPFVDLARRARQIREAALSLGEGSRVRFDRGLFRCFYRSSKPLLDFVRQHTYGEFRTQRAR